MTDDDLKALADWFERKVPPEGPLPDVWLYGLEAASAIRQLMRERDEAIALLRDIDKWLAKPEWGTWPYTEGDGLYNDSSDAADMIRIFFSTHPPTPS